MGDEDGEGDIVDLDVCPGDVAHKTLSANPRLQTGSIQAAGDGDAVEVNVGDVGEFTLALAEGTNRQTWKEVLVKSHIAEVGKSTDVATHRASGNQ